MRSSESLYERIYRIVRLIPPGKVATYGQISRIAGRCSPRNVGYAMSSVASGSGIPWHRVINSRGMISIRSDGSPSPMQRSMLESEGVVFRKGGSIDLEKYGWEGPMGDNDRFGE